MFGFLNEFLNDVNVPKLSNKSFKMLNIDGKFLYIENFKKIISVNKNEINIKLFSGEINVFGENLSVKEIGIKSINISGKILKIEQVI